MTTTPSPELPDLDNCPFCGSTSLHIETNSVQPDDYHDAWVHCDECDADGRHAMTLEGWLSSKEEAKQEAAVAWNRRAKPEGEAPQAEQVKHVAYFRQHSTFGPWVECRSNEEGAVRFTAPAAQQAESGALCEGCEGKGGWKNAEWIDPVSGPECEWERCTDCEGTGRVSAVELCARCDHSGITPALAAQSQGAQPVAMECRRYCKGDAEWTEWRAITAAEYERRKGDSAFEFRPIAAQQAAAPGALPDLLPPLGIHNDRDMLNYLMVAFDNEIGTCERCGHSEPTKHMDSAGFLRDYLAAAPSAPGTPEAPADPNAQRWLWVQDNIRDGYELPGGFYLPDHDTSSWDRTVDAARAAQLDGGQGEGK